MNQREERGWAGFVFLLCLPLACGGASKPADQVPGPAESRGGRASDAVEVPGVSLVTPGGAGGAASETASGSASRRQRTLTRAKAGAAVTPAPPTEGLVPYGLARGAESELDKRLLGADRAYADGRYQDAVKGYRAAAKMAPGDPAPIVGVVRASLAGSDVPTDYAARPKSWRAKAWLKELARALQLDKNYGPAWLETGRLQLILGLPNEALVALAISAKRLPGDAEAASALGVALLATGDSAGALVNFERAASLEPDNAERLSNLGTAYMMRGRVNPAIAAYERAVALTPDDSRAHGDLGTAFLGANRPDRAMPHLLRAVALSPKRATYRSNLGYAHQQSGQLEKAIAVYREALRLDPKLGSAWLNLGTALARQKKYADAEKAFLRAKKIDPTDPRVIANLKDLEELRRPTP
ncbi:MAG: tetratricopeptide repeat protein [Polyangiaceae bacterium]|nr:tetratricopeptide repeat protein [Polyangiaceae bacterium]